MTRPLSTTRSSWGSSKAPGGDAVTRPTFEKWYGLVHHVVQDKFEWAWSTDPKVRSIRAAIEYDDLVQQGSEGLLLALEWWNEDEEVKFKTYAYRVIRNQVKRYIDKVLQSADWGMIRFSEIEARMKKTDEPIQIFDPSQDEDLYNILHRDWVGSCMDRIREHLGDQDTNFLLDRAGGMSWADVAKKYGMTVDKARYRTRVLLKSALFAVKDQEELLE